MLPFNSSLPRDALQAIEPCFRRVISQGNDFFHGAHPILVIRGSFHCFRPIDQTCPGVQTDEGGLDVPGGGVEGFPFSTFPLPWKKNFGWYIRYNIPYPKRPWKIGGKLVDSLFHDIFHGIPWKTRGKKGAYWSLVGFGFWYIHSLLASS